ncbi:MAG: tetratricopeptide repeat protein [Thermoanaerobaculia bacterium]
MKTILAGVALFALTASPWLATTNSRAATKRGMEAWEKNDAAAAVRAFGEAERLDKTKESAANLATAEIAAGEYATGLERLAPLVDDPDVGRRALYNRGTGALLSGDLSRAIDDLSEYLRREPADVSAKRNLELALRRNDERQRQRQQQRRQQEQQQRERGEDKGEGEGKGREEGEQSQRPGDIDAESLLRSVAQQEKEELSRMRRAGRERSGIGW